MLRNFRWMPAACVLALLAAAPARAQYADLKNIPADAVLSGHVLAGELMKSDTFKMVREVIAKAGPDALKTFEGRFPIHPGQLERISFFVKFPSKPGSAPDFAVTVSGKETIDPARFIKALGEEMTQGAVNGKTMFLDRQKEAGLLFLDSKTLVFGSPTTLAALKPAEGPAAAALAKVTPEAPMVLYINRKAIPDDVVKDAPPEIKPVLAMDHAVLIWQTGKNQMVKLLLAYPGEQGAKDAQTVILQGQEMARQQIPQFRNEMQRMLLGRKGADTFEEMPEAFGGLLGIGAANWAEEILKKPVFTQTGSNLTLDIPVPSEFGPAYSVAPISIGLLLPAVQKVRAAAGRTQDANNLKQMGLAMHFHHDAMGAFPGPANYGKDGKPLLSWRVHILPLIEQEALYRQFKLDEPWDSANNKPLIALMPKIYSSPGEREPKQGFTPYRVPVMPGAVFEPKQKITINAITDGTSNTLMIYTAAKPIEWTKPDELDFDPKNPLPKLADFFGGSNIALCDGSVRFLKIPFNEELIKALVTRNGGEIINIDGPYPVTKLPTAVPSKSAPPPKVKQ